MAKRTVTFIGKAATAAQPTQAHRPAIWECMLGTVYALDEAGECKYFDYDRAAAYAWAGVDTPGADLRFARINRQTSRSYIRKGATEGNPRFGQGVLWVRRANRP